MLEIGFVVGCCVGASRWLAWCYKVVQKNILNFLRSKGYDDALTYGGGSTSS